jgi:hypothetical protein
MLQQGSVHYNQAAQSTQEITEMAEEKFQQVGEKWIEQLEEFLEQAYKLSPRDPFIIKYLQRIYQRLRRPEKVKK